MTEFNVSVDARPGEITFNLDALKESLTAEMGYYKNLVVTEDTVKESKKDLAMLRKVSKELNDRKIEVKKSFMKPYESFEAEVKEALAIINEPIELIDAQVKEFEQIQKEEKKAHCKEIYDETIGDMADFLPYERVFDDGWLKASVKDRDITGDIETQMIRVTNDINAIKALASEIETELFEIYKRTGELSVVIQKNTDYLNTKSLVAKHVEAKPNNYPVEVHFVVNKADADKVREMLEFSDIDFREE